MSSSAITGTSGSGKSTLLHMLGGLDTPTSGTISVGNTELSGLNDEQLTVFRRRRIGFIFQNYNLIPTLNVWENIVFPVAMDGQKPDREFIREILQLPGTGTERSTVCRIISPAASSSVWRLRVALASKPDIILADEPTGKLDSRTSDNVIALRHMTSRKFHQTIIMITHNPEIAQMTDRMIRIEDGRIIS